MGGRAIQDRDPRSRGAWKLRVLLTTVVVAWVGVALSACGSGAGGVAESSAAPAATTEATPLQTYLDALKPALASATRASEAEYVADKALGAGDHDTAVNGFREAARLYAETGGIMRQITIPPGLEATRQLAAAQHDYAGALDRFTDYLDSGAGISQTKSRLAALFAAGKRYDLALRRYNRALIVESADQGLRPAPWLVHPFFSSAVRGR